MTNDTPPGVRIIADGGTAPVTKTVKADGVAQREIDGEEREVLRVPISSTRPDRENDRFSKEALDDMAEQLRTQQPHVFDNHGLAGGWMDAIPYDSRETIGTQFDAEVEEADDGEYDLYAFINPDGTHEEGTRMLKQVRDEKQAIKFSVGFGIGEEEPITDEAGNEVGREFQQADLMETSRVGIPANPDASLGVAAKSGGVAPGFAMHPMFRAMFGGEDGDHPAAAAKAAGYTPEGEPDDLRAEVAELRGQVERLTDALDAERDTDTKGSCDVDTDCPEGEVCIEGECVPEEEVDDDDDDGDGDEDSASADADLEARIAELEKALDEGPGEPDSKATTTEEPDLTNDAEPDGEKDADDDGEEKRRTATDIARGN